MDPRGTCSECGTPVYGDGDIAQQLSTGAYICLVCFLDPERLRALNDRTGLVDPSYVEELIAQTRAINDEFRGRELRRRAAREQKSDE